MIILQVVLTLAVFIAGLTPWLILRGSYKTLKELHNILLTKYDTLSRDNKILTNEVRRLRDEKLGLHKLLSAYRAKFGKL